MKDIWVLQYITNAYDQDGYYTIQYWIDKPTLEAFSKKPITELNEKELINLVKLYTGTEVDGERFIQCTNGKVPFELE